MRENRTGEGKSVGFPLPACPLALRGSRAPKHGAIFPEFFTQTLKSCTTGAENELARIGIMSLLLSR